MTRVAILVEQNWNAVPGGTARSTNSLADALRAYTSTRLLGVTGAHRGDPVLDLPDGLALQRLPVPGRLMTHLWDRFGWPSPDRLLDVDLVHAPAYLIPPSSLPTVVTVHDLAFVHHPEWFTPHGVRFLNRFLERVVASEAAVIAPSTATADDCVVAGISEERLTVIPWGVDPTLIGTSRAEEIRRSYGLPEDFVLYVGTLEPRKNLVALTSAMALGAFSAPLVIVGPSGWGQVEVGDAVVLGELPTAQVHALMAAASVLAYPSHLEGFGLPVLEAMAQGTPVLVTAGTAPEEIAGDAGVAVDTRDPVAIADAIAGLLEDPSQRELLGNFGRARAAQYDWAHTARATAAVYESVVS